MRNRPLWSLTFITYLMNSPLRKQPHSWHCLLFTWKSSLILLNATHTQTNRATLPCFPHPTRALRPHSRHLFYLHGPPPQLEIQHSLLATVTSSTCVLSLLCLCSDTSSRPLCWVEHYFTLAWAKTHHGNSAKMDVFSHLLGFWHLHLIPYTVAAFPSLPSPWMCSSTLHIAMAICLHPGLSRMPFWLGPHTGFGLNSSGKWRE